MKKNIFRSLIITALLWLCASSMWATITWPQAYHFYDDSFTQWNCPYVMLMAYTSDNKVYVTNLNKLEKTNLYHIKKEKIQGTYGSIIGLSIVGDDEQWTDGLYSYNEAQIQSMVKHYTSTNTESYARSNHYVHVGQSPENGTTFTTIDLGNLGGYYWKVPNYTISLSMSTCLYADNCDAYSPIIGFKTNVELNYVSLSTDNSQIFVNEGSAVNKTSVSCALGTPLTISIPNALKDGYVYEGLYSGSELITLDTTYTFDVRESRSFTVRLVKYDPHTITFGTLNDKGTVSATVNDEPISSGDFFDRLTTIEFTAHPIPGYTIEKWYNNGAAISSSSGYTNYTLMRCSTDVTIQAKFKPRQYTLYGDVLVGTTSEGGEMQMRKADGGVTFISPTTSYKYLNYVDYDSEVLLTATPDDDHLFLHWSDADGNILSTDNPYSYTYKTVGNDTVYAQFQRTKTLYLRAQEDWLADNARFAAYAWESGNSSNSRWFDMSLSGCTDVYTCKVPDNYDKIIFHRMNPASDSNELTNSWAQTNTLTVPATTSTTNIFTAPSAKSTWDSGSYVPGKVTVNANSGTKEGSVSITDEKGNVIKVSGATVPLNTQLTITITPHTKETETPKKRTLANANINIGPYYKYEYLGSMYSKGETITLGPFNACGPVTINAYFVSQYDYTIYLRPNDEWLKDNARFAVYAYSTTISGAYEWYELTTKDKDYTGAFSTSISQSFDRVKFVRLDPNGADPHNNGLNWNNAWNQTDEIEFGKSYDGKRYAIDNAAWESNTVIWTLNHNTNYSFKGYPGRLSNLFNTRFNSLQSHKLYNEFTGQYYTAPSIIVRETSYEWLPLSHDANNDQTKFAYLPDVDLYAQYQFNLQFVEVGDSLQKQIKVIYPTNHYHLVYTDDTGVKRNGRYLSKITSGTKQCIVSFFINKDANPKIGVSDSDADPTTWTNISVDESYVYNFTMEMTPDTVTISDTYSKYQGNYYIRTDGAAGEWHNYQTNADNRLTQFDWQEGELYNYYWVRKLSAKSNGKINVRACVANDYNSNLAGIIIHDLYTDERGDVSINPQNETLNLRFGYSPYTNHFSRAMLTSTQQDDFLNIVGENLYADKQCTAPLNTANANSKFTDLGDWIYEKHVYVHMPNTSTEVRAQLLATAYNQQTQSLLGFTGNTPNTQVLLGAGTSAGVHNHRTIYDFKTNRLLMAWMPDDTDDYRDPENQGLSINANMLFMRRENEDATQFRTYAARGVLQKYFAMEFVKTDDASRPQEEQYFFSLPYSCTIQDVFGIPGYMSIWGIQRYRGDLRAEKGWFIETPTFWEWMQPTDQLLPGEGYVLIIDKSAAPWPEAEAGEESILRLYFPSSEESSAGIDSEHYSHEYPNEPCIITREQRDKQDSNWKMIGTTIYSNAAVQSNSEQAGAMWNAYPNFRYEYAYKNGKWGYTPVDGKNSEYKSFYGYMVQFAGTIQWTPANTAQQQIMARKNANAQTTSHQLRLELLNSQTEKEDQAFVTLQEDATTTFDQNKDLNKIINAGNNIYTLSEGIPFAGNSLPVDECVVPVGLQLAQAGEYTFSMPDGTDGLIVELIDYTTGARTDLLYFDYTVELTAGTINDRFALHLMPYKQGVSTQLNQTADALQDSHVIKCIINGNFYMRKDGIWYDAQGRRVTL